MITMAASYSRLSHLDAREIRRLQLLAEWPEDKPVFTPYAINDGGYSSITISRKRYMLHRVVYKAYHSSITNDDVLYTLCLRDKT